MSITRVVLATGIYPPDIGGPATYARELARELIENGVAVTVVTYARRNCELRIANCEKQIGNSDDKWLIIRVPFAGGPLLRWWRYARALKNYGSDADIIYAFSSVSCGIPLWLAGLRKPKKILRLGGDFLWERYTDLGGEKSLREFHENSFWFLVFSFWMKRLLNTFDYIVFSTRFQEEIYEKHYKRLPRHSVIENAAPSPNPLPLRGARASKPHDPFRLLWMGRMVGFKNLPALIEAISDQRLATSVSMTLVGDGPLYSKLKAQSSKPRAQSSKLGVSITFHPPVHGDEKQKIFSEHDLLILPSLTEISPNVALEARAAGLPVLLTEETGLSEVLSQGIVLRSMRTAKEIASAIEGVMKNYSTIASGVSEPPPDRSWERVTEEHLQLFNSIL